jgi:hypothetical protein
MEDFVNNIEILQYKAPGDLPDANSRYINSAEETNVCVTQQIRNAMTLCGVSLPNEIMRSNSIDPLFLSKTIQHYASFAQTYILDASSTANNIIITPSVNNVQLQTVLLENNGSEIVVTTNNIDGLVDAQVFDELPNGAIFQFIPLLSNTSSNVNLTVRIKRLKWDISTLSQIIETKNFLYPIKDIDGTTNISANDIIGNKLIIVHFDKNNNAFKLVNKTIIASQTVAGVIKTSTTALVNAGIDDTTALTPLQLKTKMEAVRKSVVFHNTRDFTETEYDYAGNIILVRKSMAATRIIGTNGSIVFNTAFPTACYNVQISLEFGAATGSQLYWNTPSPTGFNFGWSAFNTVGNGNSCIINIIATGK